MKTYQDLLAVGESDRGRMEFILSAIREHKASAEYRAAADAQLYYDGENPTIYNFEKILVDLQGKAYKDMYSANHKISSSFFGFAVDQEVSYLLGNGVSFSKEGTKKKLGKTFDLRMRDLLERAAVESKSFGFWNYDHLEVFSIAETEDDPSCFAPLYDEEDGALKAGVRFWQIDDSKPLRATLYELDGYTDYIKRKDKDIEILHSKRSYKQIKLESVADGVEIRSGENYPGFPIIPLKYNKKGKSKLCGKRNTIDALDLVTSNMVNNVDEGNLIYWVLTNCGGMNDLDDIQFIERLKTTHVAHADGDEGARAEAHSIEAPYAATKEAIDTLTKRLYVDFQAFDASAVAAGNQTATAIKASYTPLDLLVDKTEAQVTDFILSLLELIGIDDEPTYTRSQIINAQEAVNTVLAAADYLDEEYMTKKILTVLGDGDQYDELMKRRVAEESVRFTAPIVGGSEDEGGADEEFAPPQTQ